MNTSQPWLDEPDQLRFTDENTGLECIILRNPDLGHLNGYVIIPSNRILHGKDYDDEIFDDIEVRGGLSFSDYLSDFSDHSSNTTQELENCAIELRGKYAIGFDCGHYDDYVPGINNNDKYFDWSKGECVTYKTYKDISFVKAQCISLAKQLFELAKSLEQLENT